MVGLLPQASSTGNVLARGNIVDHEEHKSMERSLSKVITVTKVLWVLLLLFSLQSILQLPGLGDGGHHKEVCH